MFTCFAYVWFGCNLQSVGCRLLRDCGHSPATCPATPSRRYQHNMLSIPSQGRRRSGGCSRCVKNKTKPSDASIENIFKHSRSVLPLLVFRKWLLPFRSFILILSSIRSSFLAVFFLEEFNKESKSIQDPLISLMQCEGNQWSIAINHQQRDH